MGDRHRFRDCREGGRLQQRLIVELAVGEAGGAGQRACRDIDQQLVPHRADNVVADRGGQPCGIESFGNRRRPRGDPAIEFADIGGFAGNAGLDVPRVAHHAADVRLAGQHALAPYDVSKDILMPQAVLQREDQRFRSDQCQCAAHRLIGIK